jgi:hypothetical protein
MPKRQNTETRNECRIPTREEQRLSAIDACREMLGRSTARPYFPGTLAGCRATWWVDYMMEEPDLILVTHCLGKYMGLTEEEQKYVVAAREDNIRWRGDDMAFFRTVAENTMVWRDLDDDGKARLKVETIRKAKNFVRQPFVHPNPDPGHEAVFDPAERSRQLDALYRLMTPEQRAAYDALDIR